MKVAITSTGKTLEDKMDPRFGRCEVFIIFDTESKEFEAIENEAKDGQHGAGTSASSLIGEKGADIVISGEFGPKAKEVLEQLNVKMLKGNAEKSVMENINDLV